MPDIIIDNLQPLVILAIVVVTLVKKVLDGQRANKSDPRPTLEDIFGPDAAPGETDHRPRPMVPPPVRQTTMPPPLRQATTPPPLHRGAVAAPAGDANAELARQRSIEERIRKIRDAKLKAQAASAPVHEVPVAHRQAPISHGLKLRLHHRKELRRAFILKEILDRPLGLR